MIRNTPAGVAGHMLPGRLRSRLRSRLDRIGTRRRARAASVTGLVRRGRAWAPTAKSAALFILPLPLAVATIAALIEGDLAQIALAGGGLTALWTAGACAFEGLACEARYALHQVPGLPRVRFKLLSAVLTVAGVLLAALAGGHPLTSALIFAIIALAGHLAFYGPDIRPRRIRVATADGVDRALVEQLLTQAHSRLRRIETAVAAIAAPALRPRLDRVVATGRAILLELERRPAEASRARRFLNVYLDGAERVTTQYARATSGEAGPALDQQFDQLLTDVERTFEAQHRRLVERDRMALDVDIEVLTARLRQEALADVENRP